VVSRAHTEKMKIRSWVVAMRARIPMTAPAVVALVPFLFTSAVQNPSLPKAYNVDEAYQIYSLLIPSEGAYKNGNGTLIIQEETVSWPVAPGCVSAQAADRFKDALASYAKAQKHMWRLERQFQIERPYKLVPSDTIHKFFNEHGPEGWHDFYREYPNSGGFIAISPVGFNQSKTLAVVYSGSSYGSQGAYWSFHLLEKGKGGWRLVPGVTCAMVS